MKQLFVLVIICMIYFGCTSTSQKKTMTFLEMDLGSYFEEYDGVFVLLNQHSDEFLVYNKEKIDTQASPCSTFKIINALIGLDVGVLVDENTLFAWDGTDYKSNIWNQDQTLSSAIVNSSFWCFQENAKKVGLDTMQDYLNRLNYGNRDISGGLTQFWEQSSLKISPIEQVEILCRIYAYSSPFSQESTDIVKNILVISSENGIILSGKTGSGLKDRGRFIPKDKNDAYIIGWFVGVVEKEDNMYFFATKIEGDKNAYGGKAKEITIKILKDIKVLN
jgi:bla regulator protein BlaR1